jgi:ABC-type proline/glycine betaine transport system substrate-binding protein
MKKTTFACLLGAASMVAGAGNAAELGAVDQPIKLAINEWTGQHVTTHIAGEMLKAAGYKVEYVTAGMMNQFQAIADGEIHATLEMPSKFPKAASSIWAIWNLPPKRALPTPPMWPSCAPVCPPGKR